VNPFDAITGGAFSGGTLGGLVGGLVRHIDDPVGRYMGYEKSRRKRRLTDDEELIEMISLIMATGILDTPMGEQ